MIDNALFKYFTAIGDIKTAISASKNIEDALRQCAHIIRDVSKAETIIIWYHEKSGDGALHLAYALGSRTFIDRSIQPGEGIVGKVFSESKSRFIPEMNDGPIRSMICVPLENTYETLGCIQMINRQDGQPFTEEDFNVCEIMSMLAATTIDEKGLNVGVVEAKPVIVSLRGLIKEFINGDNTVSRILKGIDLDVYEGEVLVILGESGCGKSTLLNVVGGMDQLTQGTFTYRGEDYSRVPEKVLTEYRRDHIGFIFQSYNLMPNLTALQNIRIIAELKEDSGDPEEVLEWVGLGSRRNSYPSQLSGGQQQRISIARALVKNPELVLADEPTAALDYTTSIEVLSVIEKVAASGTSILMVTHNEEIAKMANRVIHLRSGVIDEVIVNRHPLKATELQW